jgi:anti-sigma factor RsiW
MSCRACRADLAHYAQGDLPAARRTLVATHLDTCDACYQALRQHREAANQYKRALPVVGQPDMMQLSRVWSAVQDDLIAPAQPKSWRGTFSTAMLVFSLLAVMALSGFVSGDRAVLAVPNPPTPIEADALTPALETEAVTVENAVIRPFATQVADASMPGGPTTAITLPAHPNYAPQVQAAATQAP